LVLNLETAKTPGFTASPKLIVRADEINFAARKCDGKRGVSGPLFVPFGAGLNRFPTGFWRAGQIFSAVRL